jgi:hypothetical protein
MSFHNFTSAGRKVAEERRPSPTGGQVAPRKSRADEKRASEVKKGNRFKTLTLRADVSSKPRIAHKEGEIGRQSPPSSAASSPEPHFQKHHQAWLEEQEASSPDRPGQDFLSPLQRVRNEVLLASIRAGNVNDTIKALHEGADPNAMTEWGVSALHLICLDPEDYMAPIDYREFCKKVGAEAKSDAVAEIAKAPHVSECCEKLRAGSKSIATALLERGADANVKSRCGKTPLHKAVALLNLEIIELLLANKARVDVSDAEKNTPLHVAAGLKGVRGKAVVELLLDFGGASQLEVQNNQGLTPIDIARGWEGDEAIKDLLVAALARAQE